MNQSKFYFLFLCLFSLSFVACNDDDMDDDTMNNDDTIQAFVSSNTTGNISVITFTGSEDRVQTISVPYDDADGIYYKEGDDRLFQVSRTDNNLVSYVDFRQQIEDGAASLTPDDVGTADFTNGRGVASNGDKIVVVQDGNDGNDETNKLIVYNITSNGFTLRNVYTTTFNLWGVELEGDRLYAIQDNSNRISVFEDFFENEDGEITPDKTISVAGLVRTHGLHFVDDGDIMILTDVGDGGSDSDGALFIIDDYKNKVNALLDNGALLENQTKTIKGSATGLGNPVDVAYDEETRRIYVAERANKGGRVLVFDYPETSNSDSFVTGVDVPGASSIFLYTDR